MAPTATGGTAGSTGGPALDARSAAGTDAATRSAAREGSARVPGEGVGRLAQVGAQAAHEWLGRYGDELVALRRQLHAHPELGREEYGTTDLLCARLSAEGLVPHLLPSGSGLWVDVDGPAARGRPDPTAVVLRADLDALPLDDVKDVPYRSTVPGVCHACGHDVHTTVLLGTALVLQAISRGGESGGGRAGGLPSVDLPGRVRLVFQPAEELMPGGAHDVLQAGVLDGVASAMALHCDPSLDVGKVGLKTGPITAASDRVEVRLRGPGGHTSRPQNTVDLVYALGRVVTELPAALTRLVDPRAAMTLVWGVVSAGSAPNAIPRSGVARGTVRMLDRDAWDNAPQVVRRLARELASPYGAEVVVDYQRGVPPVVNGSGAVEVLRAAAEHALGSGAAVPTAQSLGGEDFGWYLERVPGAMARLGTRWPDGPTYDLHQARFDVDERCIGAGVRLLTTAAIEALAELAA